MAPGLGCRVSGLGFRALNSWFRANSDEPNMFQSSYCPALLLGYLTLHRIEAVSHGAWNRDLNTNVVVLAPLYLNPAQLPFFFRFGSPLLGHYP